MKRLSQISKIVIAVFIAMFANGLAPTLVAALVPPNPAEGVASIQICHANNSDSSPYVSQQPSTDSANLSGHASHSGPVWNPTLKPDHDKWGDIIPPYTDMSGRYFEGLNWDADGQAFYANDCVIPATASPTASSSIEPCTVVGTTDTVTISITNTNDVTDATVSYTITLAGQTKTLSIADGETNSATFTGVAAGTYTATITGDDNTSVDVRNIIVNACVEHTNTVVTPAAPTVNKITACGTRGSISLTPTTGVTYTWVTGSAAMTEGAYKITATPNEGFAFEGESQSVTYEGNLGTYQTCIQPCEVVTGPTLITAKEQFATATVINDQRADGHHEFTSDGLHIWTTVGDSTSKIAWYNDVTDYPLASVGAPSMEYTATGTLPGLQLVIDFNGDGSTYGTLVGESIYGNDWWLTNGSPQSIKDNAPSHTGGFGSENHGTLAEWLTNFPNAKVAAIGFSLGSGVKGDGILKSLTVGCHKWVFQKAAHVPTVCTVKNNSFTTPWTYDGETYPTAAAWPEEGIAGSYEFTTNGLHIKTPQTESYTYGLVNAGNTPLVDIDAMSYKTFRLSTNNDQLNASYILYVDLDGNLETTGDRDYLFYEPIYNGTTQTGVWQTWDVINNGNSVWSASGLTSGNPSLTWNDIITNHASAVAIAYGYNMGTYNAGSDVVIQDIAFDCAVTHFSTPQVLGEQDDAVTPVITPVVATPAKVLATTTPSELPATGGENNYLVLGIALSMATYYIAFRRQEA